jgi:hypothetical protein
MVIRSFAIAAVLMIAATPPALAQAQARASSGYDPNERVCESIPVVGSRLAKKKVCATRAEWEEKRRLDREAIDQAQKQIGGPCSVAGNKNTGGPSC